MYQVFLMNLPRTLSSADLPEALRWCERFGGVTMGAFAIQRLVDAIFLKAWMQLDNAAIREPFGRAALRRFSARL